MITDRYCSPFPCEILTFILMPVLKSLKTAWIWFGSGVLTSSERGQREKKDKCDKDNKAKARRLLGFFMH